MRLLRLNTLKSFALLLGLLSPASRAFGQALASSTTPPSALPKNGSLAPMEIVITPTRLSMPVGEESSDTTVVSRDSIQASGQPVLDDVLRPIPGFNTFRRSSSIVTAPADDPEAQGVTLRGIGPGGASRALILENGVPVNDAFGGWIYWDELSPTLLDRIEIVNGAVPIWGNGAEGGVINLIPQQANGSGTQAGFSYGTRNTVDGSLLAGYKFGAIQAEFGSDTVNTDGYDIVAPAKRGPIDHNSSSFHSLNGGRIQFEPSDHLTLFVGGHYYEENRDLGTPFRRGSANRHLLEGGGTWVTPLGQFHLLAYSHISSMDETYSLVNPPRSAETRLQIQHVPSTDVGGSLIWTRIIFPHDQIVAGGDVRLIDGQSDDSYYNTAGSAVDDRTTSAGRQNFFGTFIENVYRPAEALEADFALRTDLFQNLAGQIKDRPVGGKATATRFADRTRTASSPKIGLRYTLLQLATLRGNLYEAFRAPTLAELYRQSSVERLVLVPNPKLAPEFLQGGDIAIESKDLAGITLSVTGYWDILHKPISNVVTAVSPVTGADAQRTRENLGRARIRGYEVRFDYDARHLNWYRWAKYNPALHLAVDYLRSEAKLVYNPPDPTLEGRRLALVPWDSGTGQVTYHDDLIGTINTQLTYQGKQWEDSDNHDRQPAYWLLNVSWSHRLLGLGSFRELANADVYVKIQNALNDSYVVDLGGGIPKVGTPFMLQSGISLPLWF